MGVQQCLHGKRERMETLLTECDRVVSVKPMPLVDRRKVTVSPKSVATIMLQSEEAFQWMWLNGKKFRSCAIDTGVVHGPIEEEAGFFGSESW